MFKTKVEPLSVALSLVLFLGCVEALASDWKCTETASEKRGNTLLVCGIGIGPTEQEARIDALRRAKEEFRELCSESDDCKNHQLNVVPLRNECRPAKEKNKIICYRALRYDISEKLNASSQIDQQKRLLDEEIELTEERLKNIREIKVREKKLATLKGRVENPEEESPIESASDNQQASGDFIFGLDLIGVSTAAAPGDYFSFMAGISIKYQTSKYLILDAGASLDLQSPGGYRGLEVGFSFYGAAIVPIVQSVHSNMNKSSGTIFVAPEYRFYRHQSISTGGFGATVGYQSLALAAGSLGWGLRLGVANAIGVQPNPAFVALFSILWGP